MDSSNPFVTPSRQVQPLPGLFSNPLETGELSQLLFNPTPLPQLLSNPHPLSWPQQVINQIQPYHPQPTVGAQQGRYGSESQDENDPYTQETDMSGSNDTPASREKPKAQPPSEGDMRQAREWMAELGLNAEDVRGVAEKLGQATSGLLAEQGSLESRIGSLEASIENWEDALDTIRMGMRLPGEEGTGRQGNALATAEQGMEEAIAIAHERLQEMKQGQGAVNARIAGVQELNALLTESPQPPWCPICATHPVDTAAQPCGHMYCSSCAREMLKQRAHNRPCFICRTRCKSVMQVHFA